MELSKTYTWPESKDEVMKFAELYYSKKASCKKPIKNCGGGGGLGRVDLLDQSLKKLSVDEEKRFLKELDAKIERLKKRIVSETAKKEEKCVRNGTSEGSERMILNNVEFALANPIEDENEKLVRDLERVTEALKEKINGKRKLGGCIEGEPSDGRSMKEMKLNIMQVKKMLHEVEGLMKDVNNDDGDDGTRLTLGR